MFTDAGPAKAGHTAIVTGANHGIGAATAHALARRGSAVLCTFLRVDDAPDPGTPQAYRDNRARDAAAVVARIKEEGGTAVAVEADLSDPATPAVLFDTAEEHFGPVDILVNNATGWLADTFAPGQPIGSPSLAWGPSVALAQHADVRADDHSLRLGNLAGPVTTAAHHLAARQVTGQ